jgi:DNA-binding LytR/AlgR family response regulator
VTAERIEEALRRVVATVHERQVPEPVGVQTEIEVPADDNVIAVDNGRGGTMRLVSQHSIFYVRSYGDYVRIYAEGGRFLLRASLTDFERRFAEHGFLRVHRQYLANLSRITEIRPMLNGTAVLRLEDDSEIPVARRHVSELRRRLRL